MLFTNAVLGLPVSHSLSPKIHSLAYDLLGLPFRYVAKEMTIDGFRDFVSKIIDEDYRGLSVTMPLKFLAATCADRLSNLVRRCGVANTLVFESHSEERVGLTDQYLSRISPDQKTFFGKSQLLDPNTQIPSDSEHMPDPRGLSSRILAAYNTDVYGIIRTIFHYGLDCSEVAILGCGATAASVLLALEELSCTGNTVIYARNLSAAKGMQKKLCLDLDILPISTFKGNFSCVISTLPSDVVLPIPRSVRGTLFDVNYNPWPTGIARSWPTDRVVSGRLMLVEQAIAQISLFCFTQLTQEMECLLRDTLYARIVTC
ncbi:MAG: shikimate dehydrogenase [Tropheryma whipplei]|nr:shikimate dehydrogenase [Tropheryma whipplei]